MRAMDRLAPAALKALDKATPFVLRLTPLISPTPPESPLIDRTLHLTVRSRSVVAADENVVSLEFTRPDGGELPSWRSGAHIDLSLPSGAVRQYSLCGDPRDRSYYRIAVRRIPDGNGGSVELHDKVRVGDTLEIHGPRNAFPLATSGHFNTGRRRFHFIAGGIGVTPILPMLATATEVGLPWTMTYVGRSKESIPFRDELDRYGDRITVRTDDEFGLPTAEDLIPQLHRDLAVYCCGPGPMLTVVRDAVAECPGAELHFERFAAPPIKDGVPFDVQLNRSGALLSVPADRSALQTILAARPGTAHSCRQGFCGTCKVRVLDGVPDHRDTILTDAQRADGEMLICVSRANGGRLVLDL
jgi:ferredoxin-NADP reductase